MNFNNYTQKSLEAVQSARDLAVQNNHQQMEQVHLLLALLRQDGGLIPQLLRKMDVTVESLEAAAAAELRKIPAVTGSRDADRFYITADVDAAFQKAEEEAKTMKDEFVSVEHLFHLLVIILHRKISRALDSLQRFLGIIVKIHTAILPFVF